MPLNYIINNLILLLDVNDYGMMGDMWFGWGWVWIIIILAIISLAYLAYLSSKSKQESVNENKEDSMEIAKQRLAKGEITTEEFDKIKSRLK